MENFQFNLSTKYYFGQNEHKNVGKILAEHKEKLFNGNDNFHGM